MGSFTEFQFGARLPKETPEEVIEALNVMVGNREARRIEHAPKHPLFECDRWAHMFTAYSAHFSTRGMAELVWVDTYNSWCLTVHSSFKNYNDEITKFVDWISPYLEEIDGDFLGYHRYESDRLPTLIIKGTPVVCQKS